MDETQETVKDTAEVKTSQDNNSATEQNNSVDKPESKNARRKRERAEKLPRDPVFSNPTTKSSENNKSTPNFDVKSIRAQAKIYSGMVAKTLDNYFSMRSAMMVDIDAQAIRPITSADFGDVTFYVDDNGNTMRGPLSEGVAFHLIVLGGGSVVMLHNFIKKHRTFSSVVAVIFLSLNMEYTIRKHTAAVEQIVKRQEAARDAETQKTYQVNTEVAEIKIEPTPENA
jgi:hypothetical protein